MKRAYCLTFLAAAGAFFLSAFAADESFLLLPPRAVITKMPAARIDGVLDESEKKNSVGMCGFFATQWHGGRIFAPDTRFNLSTDGKNLVISGECETGPDGIRCRVAGGGAVGSKVCLDDTYELVIVPDPAAEIPSIYHMIINNVGSYMTASRKGPASAAWNPDFKQAGTVKDGIWTFEISFPLKQFGIDELKDGQTIGLRICRNWRGLNIKDYIQTSWSQIKCAFFSTDGLPLVTYREHAPVIRALSYRTDDKTDMRMSFYNPAEKELTLSVRFENKPSFSQSSDRKDTLTLKPGEIREISFPAVTPTKEEYVDTFFEVSDPADGQIWYRRAFRWELAKPNLFAVSDARKEPVLLQYAYYPSNGKMFLRLINEGLKSGSMPDSISAVVLDSAGRELAKTKLPAFSEKGLSEHLWQLPDLKECTKTGNPSGEYVLRVELAGKTGLKLERKFQRKVFEWEGNSYGKTPLIIPGFTPLQVNGKVVSTVLRDHLVGAAGLPVRIQADGAELLKEDGIHFEAVVDGKSVPVKGGGVTFTKVNDREAEAAASWSAGALQAEALCHWDYDGVLKYTFTLKPFAGKVDSLKLIVPMDSEQAYLFHPVSDGLRIHYGGATPERWNSREAARRAFPTDFMGYIWLGTEGRGLSVFGENDHGWVTSPGVPAQEMVRKDGVTYLIYNLIAQSTVVDSPRTIELGFQATPVKPMVKNWRRRHAWAALPKAAKYMDYSMQFLGSNLCQGGISGSICIFPRDNDLTIWRMYAQIRKTKVIPKGFLDEWCKTYRKDSPRPAEVYRREVNFGLRSMQQSGRDNVTFYTNGRGMATYTPEAMTFMDDWFIEDFQPQRDVPPAYGDGKSYSLDPVESYRDFAMYWYHTMLTLGVTDNLYWDDMFLAPNFDFSGATGSYYTAEGRLQPSLGLWNLRELARRTAVLQLELGKIPNNMIHMTNAAIAPVLSFAQQNLDWEDNLGINPYQKRYTREYIRTTALGRQFGNLPMALGMVTGDRKKNPDTLLCLRSGTGVALTHEVGWVIPAEPYWTIKADLYDYGYGLDDVVRVWNYWEKDYPVTISGDTSSLVMAKGNEIRLVVSNYGDDGDYTARLDLRKLGIPGKKLSAVNGENGSPVAVKGNTLSFPLKKYDFIYIKITGE